MSIKARLEKLEQEAHAGGDKILCRHFPPIIHWPDGRVENENAHACDAPRLTITLRYSDGSDELTRLAAAQTFDKIQARCPEIPSARVAEIVAGEFQLKPQASRALLERMVGSRDRRDDELTQ